MSVEPTRSGALSVMARSVGRSLVSSAQAHHRLTPAMIIAVAPVEPVELRLLLQFWRCGVVVSEHSRFTIA
jgi:hypothetical protein